MQVLQRYRHVVVLAAAVAVALLTSLATYNWMRRRETTAEERIPATRPVAVAVVDLGAGTTLRADLLKTVPFLVASLPEEAAFGSTGELVGRVVTSPVRAGEPIFASRLAPTGAQGGVAALLTRGKRAMAVRVDKIIGVAGFIQPGHRVDVLVTLSRARSAGGPAEPVTKTVLENVPVLAAGVEFDKSGKDREKARQVDVITLEVSPEEGELLGLAASEGRLQLALRHHADGAEVLTKGGTVGALLSSYASEDAHAAAAAPRPRSPAAQRAGKAPAPTPPSGGAAGPGGDPRPRPAHQVTVVRGSAMSIVNFVEQGR